MKLKAWLGLSIGLNVVAFGLVVVIASRSHPAPAPTASVSAPPVIVERHVETLPAPAPVAQTGHDWMRAMRTSGVPEKLISDIAVADFEDRWQRRAREIQRQYDRGEIDED